MKLQGEKYFCLMWGVREAEGHTHEFLTHPKTQFVFSQSSPEFFMSSDLGGHKKLGKTWLICVLELSGATLREKKRSSTRAAIWKGEGGCQSVWQFNIKVD